jgi:chemotaxis protein methyltransferase CheR
MACSDSDYDYLRKLVHTRSANLVAPSRNASFEGKLRPIVQTAGAADLQEFVNILRVEKSQHLQRAVAEAMTINETSFFRDRRLFDALRHTIIPRLIESNASTRKLRIWSAAASTGQEAYSVAMLISEHFPQLADWDIKIIGTDISSQVIDHARIGIYRRLDVNRGLPARLLVRYLIRDGEQWQIAPGLKSMCRFQTANLCGELPALPRFDIVLLRNVLLYFTPQDRQIVFRGVHRHMSPDGYLLLGASEQAEDSTDLFHAEFRDDFYYYRLAPPPPRT